MRLNDAVIGLVLVIFALAEITYSTTFPSLHGQKFGPSLFPILIGCGLALCGLILIVRGVISRRTPDNGDNEWVVLGDWAQSPTTRINMMLVPGLLIAYILLSDTIGFLPLAFLILATLLYRLGSSFLSAAIIAIVTTVLLQLLFARVLLVPLPAGITGNLFG
ncbi:tripartite tricarboxylate transporter TctB family protein [Granulosicoccus antarcticus]|uniref:DUF1468 domain-containing protein n=1 Tax=Granulosicoccus antarcticus IMCC3135 TaxID=1192854 RepID=A0A2Z2NQ55_9GAMM|nr:tripartite tricarboxylate transporter TctB family protein [Granulosicoccus antarcticus]ASJ70920.1 hypothetical protein IMCC3135_04035 [Granulosicoccus antarcticus IMCC3135]